MRVKILIHYPLALIRLVLVVLASLTTIFIGYPCLMFSKNKLNTSYKAAHLWGKSVLSILNVKVYKTGHELSRQAIIMPNHRSYLDIFIMYAYSPGAMVTKKELQKWPLVGQGAKLGRLILVDRKNLASMVETMNKIKKEIELGGSVVLFPEGTTYKGPLSRPFKSGSFDIAVKTNTPVIPVALNFANKNAAWVDDDLFIPHFFNEMGKFKTEVNLWFGKPITASNKNELMDEVKDLIDEKLGQLNVC